MTDLRERVARAIWDTLGSDYTFDEAISGAEKATHAQAVAWVYSLTDAALKLIVEECAKVAEKNSDPWCADEWVEGYAEGREDAAYEIRALAKEDKV